MVHGEHSVLEMGDSGFRARVRVKALKGISSQKWLFSRAFCICQRPELNRTSISYIVMAGMASCSVAA